MDRKRSTCSFLELPDEILISIIKYLDLAFKSPATNGKSTARPSHAAFSRTCKRLQQVVTPILYREVYFERQDTEKTPASDVRIGLWFRRFFDRFGCFVRTISKRPELVEHIRSVSYKFFAVDSASLPSFLEYLARSKNLEELNLIATPGNLFANLDSILRTATDYQPFSCLRSFSVISNSSTLPATVFFSIIDLRSMRSVKCRICMPDEQEIYTYRTYTKPETHDLPPLQDLMITDSDFTPTLLDLVTVRRGVAKLFIPHLEDSGQRYLMDNTIDGPRIPCSPASLQPQLLPLRHILQSLAISNHKIRFEEHDGTVLDLSSFLHLRIVKLSDRLLLPHEGSMKAPRRGDSVLHCLPPTLEELCVCFDSGRGPFSSVQQLELIAESPPDNLTTCFWSSAMFSEDSIRSCLSWMLELLPRTSDFPQLRSLTALECYERNGTMKDWVQFDDVPKLYPNLFESEHIRTAVLIYGPPEPVTKSRVSRLPLAVRASLLSQPPI